MPADSIVPLDRAAMKPILLQAAAESGLPSDLVLAQAWAESSWQGSVVSSADAVGVLQLTAPTVDFVSHQLLHLEHQLDALNSADNARMGTRYLRHLLGKTDNNLRQALIAYNQGPRSAAPERALPGGLAIRRPCPRSPPNAHFGRVSGSLRSAPSCCGTARRRR